MEYVSVVEDCTYLLWQQEVQAFNFRELGILPRLHVVVVVPPGHAPSAHARHLAEQVDVTFVPNTQEDRSYVASNKPFGLQKLLEDRPALGEHLFLLDSDVILRAPLDDARLAGTDAWTFSPCHYMRHDYLAARVGPEVIASMAEVVGLPVDRIQAEQDQAGGPNYSFRGLTAPFCAKVRQDALALHRILRAQPLGPSDVWIAEMWAWQWNAHRVADVRTLPELEQAVGIERISQLGDRRILHMTCVLPGQRMFCKYDYHTRLPWQDPDLGHDLDPDHCALLWVEAIQAYARTGRAFQGAAA